jgi:hypothetical protein
MTATSALDGGSTHPFRRLAEGHGPVAPGMDWLNVLRCGLVTLAWLAITLWRAGRLTQAVRGARAPGPGSSYSPRIEISCTLLNSHTDGRPG